MVGMTAVFVVGAIAVVGAVVARVTWRRPGDERHSIQSHQQTLETLRSMSDRRPAVQRDRAAGTGPEPGGVSARAPRSGTGPAHASPSGAVRANPARPGSVRAPAPTTSNGNGHDEFVFVDDGAAAQGPRPGASARTSALALSRGLPRGGRGYGRGWAPRGRSRNRIVPVALAVVVLAAVVTIAVVLAPSHPIHTAQHPSTRAKTSARTKNPPPTVTVPPEVQPSTSTADTAVYSVPSSAYTVGLQATGPCWVEATETSTGNVVWTGTLSSGQNRSIPATGSLVLRLGAANDVSVTLNGQPVLLPVGFHSPFDMSFGST